MAEAVSVFRGDRLVLDRLSFSVPAGGALLLVGPNGAGKSTLLRALAGLLRLDGGRVVVDAAGGLPAAYLGHADAIKPGLSAAENLRFAASVAGGDVGAALASVGLGALAGTPARLLSAGQRRRLALARVVVSRAALWLLDEPTLGVDAASIAAFGGVLARHRAGGGMVVAATHLPLPLPDAASLGLGG